MNINCASNTFNRKRKTRKLSLISHHLPTNPMYGMHSLFFSSILNYNFPADLISWIIDEDVHFHEYIAEFSSVTRLRGSDLPSSAPRPAVQIEAVLVSRSRDLLFLRQRIHARVCVLTCLNDQIEEEREITSTHYTRLRSLVEIREQTEEARACLLQDLRPTWSYVQSTTCRIQTITASVPDYIRRIHVNEGEKAGANFFSSFPVPREMWRHGLTRRLSSEASLLILARLRDYQARRALKLANSHPGTER